MQRDAIIDFVKGSAILGMVIGHSCAPHMLVKFIYLFHMAVFCMASGFFFSVDKVSSRSGLVLYIRRRVAKLYVPFVFWSIIFFLLHNFFQETGLIKDQFWTFRQYVAHILRVPFMLTMGNGAFWFLRSLFFASCIYALVSYAPPPPCCSS